MRDNYQQWALALIFLLLILMFFVFNAILHPYAETVYITKGNIYKGFFKEPFETAIFIFRDSENNEDGDFVTFSTHHEKMINVEAWAVVDYLKKDGKDIKDCEKILHNHSTPMPFTPGNDKFERAIRALGFEGKFGIFYTFNGKVVWKGNK